MAIPCEAFRWHVVSLGADFLLRLGVWDGDDVVVVGSFLTICLGSEVPSEGVGVCVLGGGRGGGRG